MCININQLILVQAKKLKLFNVDMMKCYIIELNFQMM